MISSMSPSGIGGGGGSVVDSCPSYAPFNNNGYLIDANLNAVQNDRLQSVAKQFNGAFNSKMMPSDVNVKFSIATDNLNGVPKKWYATITNDEDDATKKAANGERFSTSTDDSDSSGSFKNAGLQICNKSDDDKPLTPDHHARRPMNAFLIFCKRHRAIVRERYPNLENRAITKILGDWWANLDENEKSDYTNLAKEYKDAFFNANPDFKWYKLPAPPLRTGYQRSNSDHRHNSFSYDHDENGADFEMPPAKKRNDGSGVGTFKLADEAQMGGLSSLLIATDNGKCTNNNNKFLTDRMEIDEEKDDAKDGNNSDNKDELHRVLGETNSFLQDTMKEYQHPIEYPFEAGAAINNIPPQQLFGLNHHHHNNSGSCSSSSGGGSPEMKNFELDSPDDDVNGYDSVFLSSKKSSRACKGKRYQEFMHAQKVNVIGKRTKPRTASTSSSLVSLSPTQQMRTLKKSLSCSPAVQKLDYDTFDHLYANHTAQILPTAAATKHETDIATAPPSVDIKSMAKDEHSAVAEARKFPVTEFELEQKINALKAHNLDEYLSRKHDTKKKKKSNDKRSAGCRKVHKNTKSKAKMSAARADAVVAAVVEAEPKTIEEAKQRLAAVGSQKRKARKESITRRDVQQVTAIVQSYSPAADPQFMPPFGIGITAVNRCGNNNGLLMLATMAEVAAANYAA